MAMPPHTSSLLVAAACALLALPACSGTGFSGGGKTKRDDAPPKPASADSDPTPTLEGGELGEQVPGGGDGGDPGADVPAVAADDPLAAVDTACSDAAKPLGALAVAPPQNPLPRTAPDDCRGGVELNNYKGKFTVSASGNGSRAVTIEIDVATYSHPDRIKLLATAADGKDHLLLDTCRLRTAKYFDPTDGASRPPEDSIRYFRAPLPAGATSVTFDFTGTSSPTYLRVVGLCDLNLEGPPDARLRRIQG